MSARHTFSGIATALLLTTTAASAMFGGPPAWAEKIAALPTPPDVRDAPAVVLLDETVVTVATDGTALNTHRWAIRILSAEGKNRAMASVSYAQAADKVRTTDAWLIREGRAVRPPTDLGWFDRSIDSYGTLYTEARYKAINRTEEAVPGDVFAAETEVLEPLLTADLGYTWGWNLPVVEETFQVRTPPGFGIAPLMHGERRPTLTRSADGREATWTVRGQPFARAEPLALGVDPDDAVLSVTLQPPRDVRFHPIALSNWIDVGNWLRSLNAAQCDTSPGLAETARRVTADAATPLAKIRAIGAYVQKLRYVSVDEGLRKGLGYQARKASQVFGQGYGDCKDKANLMRAMLREVGIDAFLTVARSGDDRVVWADIPSPRQFDHAIIAVRVDESVQLPSVVGRETLGRLLFFDPTAPHTAVGDLPWYLQGTSVFPLMEGSDALVTLPRIASDAGHRYRRHLSAQLASDGSSRGRVTILGNGQAGAMLREKTFLASTDEALRNYATTLLGDTLRGASLSAIARHEEPDASGCGVSFEFTRRDQLQFMPDGLAVARMDVFDRSGLPTLSAPERHRAVKLRPITFDDVVELELPERFSVEELPAALSIESPYGTYRRDFKTEGRKVTLTRRLELPGGLVSAAEYSRLRKFLGDLSRADRASLLLRVHR